MGYIFLLLAKIAATVKMISVKSCGTIATGTRNSVRINLIRSVGCLAVSLAVCLATGFGKTDTVGIIISVLSGISNGLLLCTWILCANKVPLCTVEVFCMIGGVVLPLVVSPLIFKGEGVALMQWIGSGLLFGAMLCLSRSNGKARLTPGSVALLVICGLSNFGCVLTKKLYTSLSVGTVEDFQLYTFLFTCVTLLLILLFFPKGEKEESARLSLKVTLYIGLAIVMLYLAEYLTTLSSGYLSSAVFYPLSYVISMPLTFLIDVVLYKEKITSESLMGIALVTLSGVLVNL